MSNWNYLKDLGLESWIIHVSDWIENSQVEPKSAERAIRLFMKYLSECGNISWNEIVREKHIHDLKGKNATFRDWLIKNIKSNHGKNNVLFFLQKFFDYQILNTQATDLEFRFVNPVDYKWDKFKTKNRSGTIRRALPLEVMEEMKKILVENNFEWSRKNFKDDYIERILNHKTGEVNENVFSLSTTLILYLLLTIPLRGIQAQLLDSGEGDEWIYDFDTGLMTKNPIGDKGRQEGFIRKVFYSGVSGQEKESLWITTNKSAGSGYEIPWVSSELIRLIGLQVEFLRKYNPNAEKVDKSSVVGKVANKKFPKFYCLFRDVKFGSNPVSKNKIYKLWGLLCLEAEIRLRKQGMDFKLTDGKRNGRINFVYDLHSLRVSGVTNSLEQGVRLDIVSKYLVRHADIKMTQYYQKVKSLRELVKVSQEESGHQYKIGLKLLGGKNEIK